LSIRVYEYGLLPPKVNAALVDDQMRLAHRYRNLLVEIELERRAAVRAILGAHADVAPLESELAAAILELETARADIKAKRSATRSRSDSADQRKRASSALAVVRDLRARVRAAKKASIEAPVIVAGINEANRRALARVKSARATCGVYWGTYLLQEAAADQARKGVTPPKFQRYTGEGRVSVQIGGGVLASSVTSADCNDTRIRIAPVPSSAFDGSLCRGESKRAMRTVLQLRVSSDERRPVWAEWPLIMSRPLPEGAVIKVATVQRRRRNCHQWDWRLQLTVDIPDEFSRRPPPRDGVVALNLGFCSRPGGGIRSGFYVGSDGSQREILVAKSDLYRGDVATDSMAGVTTRIKNAIDKADSIRSIRDKNMDAMRADMLAWLATLGAQAPEWLLERAKHVHAWRSADRFRSLAKAWKVARFDGDAAGYDMLEAWRYRDDHLECYESGLRRRAIGDRREGYRLLAAQLAARYHTLIVDDTDLRAFARSPSTESEDVGIAAVKRNMRLAAGSVLRQVMLSAFGAARVQKVSAVNVTVTCSLCRHVNNVDRSSGTRDHTCGTCGATWDQDANACRNLLAAYRVDSAQPERTPKKWTRLKSKASSGASIQRSEGGVEPHSA
jgi:hypothetical protein